MAELSEADKERIVVLLGRFKRPMEVAEILREERGLELTHDQVITYDPRHSRFRADRDKWEPIFNAAREAYITDLKQVVVANQTWRLNELHDLYDRAKKAKNLKLAADFLEQIARECGGAMTNERNVNMKDGRRARDMSSEDRAAMLCSMVAEAMAAKQAAAGETTKH